MKKIFYILFLFSFFAKAQTPMFKIGKYVVTDYHAHYMGSVNLSSFISSSAYYITKRPLISGIMGSVLKSFVFVIYIDQKATKQAKINQFKNLN